MRKTAVILATLLSASQANASYWLTSKNETDPFDKTKSTFVSQTQENGNFLAVRCLENGLSFAIGLPSGSISRSEEIEIGLVADDKTPVSISGGVISANVAFTLVQFGGEEEIEYLIGAKKFWVRAAGGSARQTIGFTGGASFDNALRQAKKACGVESLAPPAQSNPVLSPTPENKWQPHDLGKWSGKDCSKVNSCSKQYACLSSTHQLGEDPDQPSFMSWCADQPDMKY